MSGHCKLPRASALQFLWAISFLFITVDTQALTVSPSPSYDGNYVVSWGTPLGCWTEDIYPYYPTHCYSLQENGVDIASSGYSLQLTGKPVGSYEYQVYYMLFVYGQPYDAYTVEGPASVTVGTPPPRDPLPTQLTYQYETRTGDINWDGRTDIFVRRTSGGVAGNGTLEQVILRQNSSGGTFSILVPDSSQAAAASAWPTSSASVTVTDFNVDGFVDVEVKGVATAVGVAGAFDQIVFSPAAFYQAQPLGLRAVDASLKQFVGNSLDYFFNPNYFDDHAEPRPFAGFNWYFICLPATDFYGIVEGYYGGDWYCVTYYDYFYGIYMDYTAFSEEAVALWSYAEAYEQGSIGENASTQGVEEAAEEVLEVEIGGWPMEEELGATGEHTDANIRRALEIFWAILGIGRANAQEVETDEAPPQTPREPGAIYVTSRLVRLNLGQHAAIEYTTGFTTVRTISGRDSNANPAIDGLLVGEENWPADAPRFMMTRGTVTPPGATPNDAYWFLLIAANSNYDDNLTYDSLPEVGLGGYNSNGYVRGILQVTGGTSIFPSELHGFFGSLVVVPPSAFF